jgi:hypothetical protein
MRGLPKHPVKISIRSLSLGLINLGLRLSFTSLAHWDEIEPSCKLRFHVVQLISAPFTPCCQSVLKRILPNFCINGMSSNNGPLVRHQYLSHLAAVAAVRPCLQSVSCCTDGTWQTSNLGFVIIVKLIQCALPKKQILLINSDYFNVCFLGIT